MHKQSANTGVVHSGIHDNSEVQDYTYIDVENDTDANVSVAPSRAVQHPRPPQENEIHKTGLDIGQRRNDPYEPNPLLRLRLLEVSEDILGGSQRSGSSRSSRGSQLQQQAPPRRRSFGPNINPPGLNLKSGDEPGSDSSTASELGIVMPSKRSRTPSTTRSYDGQTSHKKPRFRDPLAMDHLENNSSSSHNITPDSLPRRGSEYRGHNHHADKANTITKILDPTAGDPITIVQQLYSNGASYDEVARALYAVKITLETSAERLRTQMDRVQTARVEWNTLCGLPLQPQNPEELPRPLAKVLGKHRT